MRQRVGSVWCFAALRAGYGTVVALAPDVVVRVYSGHPSGRLARGVVTVLGARHVAQALATAARPSRGALALGAVVDVTHAASMLALGLWDRPRRRAALIDAAVAGSFAIGGMMLSIPPCRARR